MSRCSICPTRYRCVLGDGPTDARVFCIGEAPGRTEDAGGRPFIGDAGREFNENYLHLAGLRRDEIYITNTVKCRPDLNRKPTVNEVAGCSQHFLPTELATINPEVVILMGATPCSLMTGDAAIDLEAEHGIPRLGSLFGWYGWIVPINHPAAGLHDTAMMIPMLEDWELLYRWLKYGEWQWALDDLKRDYGLLTAKQDAEEFLHRCNRIKEPLLIGCDSESHAGEPYSWQISLEPGVARMMMLNNKEVCKEIAGWLSVAVGSFFDPENQFVFHHAPADLPIFEQQLGFCLDGLFDDTMQQAYHLANLRQGLKPLSRRLLGRERLSWEETVTPYSQEVLAQWIMNGFAHAENYWRETTPRFHKKSGTPLKPAIKPALPEKLLRELLGYLLKNSEYPIWQKLDERMPVQWMGQLVEAIGPVPQRGIAHCPLDVQIEYACSDPDDTRQLALLFKTMRQEFNTKLNLQEEDCDQ